ncbi:hypothetical protein K505DRAFT_400805 [Melanomma pulvis-pyrius CBS 109.77]|uniref:Uncharacterized protein n=1 Tax=Melanomma pulvis-pyrius CBS 109.77 TaxID=1314802 RepID=A0A6A6XXN3_9PLEO|nr:hypothetical protein K505DRAFT_400805 [Melanomma pulvis-pyrius CBS 109.77]
MPYVVYCPRYPNPFLLEDRDANYLRYFDLWGWRIETLEVDPAKPLVVSPRLLNPFKEQDLYFVWREEVNRRSREEQRKVKELSALVKKNEEEREAMEAAAAGVEPKKKKKKGCCSKIFKWGKKKDGDEEHEMGVNHLADMQRRWS